MNPFHIALLVSIVCVAVVHTKSRIAGALAACLWCVGAAAWGVYAFQSVDALVFLGISSPPWLYFAFMGGLFVFNAGVIVRALRRRRRDTNPAPAGS